MIKKLYRNGTIITMEESLYAKAILTCDGIIKKVYYEEDPLSMKEDGIEIIDLHGHTLLPAFIDCHSHFSGYASSLLQVDLTEAVSFSDITQMITRFMKRNHVSPGEWVLCRGYDHNNLKERIHPTLALLDKVAPKNPILLQHQSGHMGVLNSLALKQLDITTETKSPEGGVIGVKDGKLTGYLEENAFVSYSKKVPFGSKEDIFYALKEAQNIYASHGITTAQEGFVVEELAGILEYLMQSNTLTIDLIGYLDIKERDALWNRFSPYIKKYHNHLKIGGYKTFLDGSAQGRTAWMLTPYEGTPEYLGYPILSDKELKQLIQIALKDDMQLLVHCNGDAATNQYINQYRSAKEELNSTNDIRPVMIHAQLLRRDQLEEVKRLSMIPSFFVAHVYYWGDTHIENFGYERASQISPANSALQKGILFTFHQDAPVIEPNMLETIWCAVNRITKKDVLIGEDERISPLEALKAVTIHGAYQYFEEDRKGSLKEGKLADLVVLSRNPLAVPVEEIKDIKVLETIKEGKTIYRNTDDKISTD